MIDPAQHARWIQATHWLKAGIADGTFTGRLPSEPHLADQMGVSYMTMRRAVGELVSEGILERQQGRGTFIRVQVQPTLPAIGFCIHRNVRHGMGNSFYGPMIHAIITQARSQGHATVSIAEDFTSFFTSPERSPICGVIGLAIPQELINQAKDIARRVPVVLVDSASTPPGTVSVSANEEQTSQLAAEHLASLRHQRIAYLAGDPESQVSQRRVQAFREHLSRAGSDPSLVQILHGDYEFTSGYAGAGQLLLQRHRPTAIYCANDTVAFGVIRRACEMGIRIPQDVSILGCGGLQQASLMPVPLTSICIPQEELGWTAWNELTHSMAGQPATAPVVVAARLQIGGTTAPPAKDAGYASL